MVDDAGYAALTEAMTVVDPEERCAPMQEAQASVLDTVSAAPLAAVPTTVVTAEGVTIRAFDDYIDPSTMRLAAE